MQGYSKETVKICKEHMQDYEICYLVEGVCDQSLHMLILPLECWMNIDKSHH